MTGPEHFRAAEQLLSGRPGHTVPQTRLAPTQEEIAVAQVHATLALAAATALSDGDPGMPKADWDTWRTVAATDGEGAR